MWPTSTDRTGNARFFSDTLEVWKFLLVVSFLESLQQAMKFGNSLTDSQSVLAFSLNFNWKILESFFSSSLFKWFSCERFFSVLSSSLQVLKTIEKTA